MKLQYTTLPYSPGLANETFERERMRSEKIKEVKRFYFAVLMGIIEKRKIGRSPRTERGRPGRRRRRRRRRKGEGKAII